jgi:hypothetical protein
MSTQGKKSFKSKEKNLLVTPTTQRTNYSVMVDEINTPSNK